MRELASVVLDQVAMLERPKVENKIRNPIQLRRGEKVLGRSSPSGTVPYYQAETEPGL